MHEASIVQSILDIVSAKCKETGCSALTSIRVRIGKAAGVLPEALQFAFEGMKAETIAKHAILIIETVPVGGVCRACEKPFVIEDKPYVLACPSCGSPSFEITSGREMDVVEMDAV